MPAVLACPPHFTSFWGYKEFLVYIGAERVSESIVSHERDKCHKKRWGRIKKQVW